MVGRAVSSPPAGAGSASNGLPDCLQAVPPDGRPVAPQRGGHVRCVPRHPGCGGRPRHRRHRHQRDRARRLRPVPRRRSVRDAELRARGAAGRPRRAAPCVRVGARPDRAAADRGRRGRPRHPRTGQRRRRDLVQGLDELQPAGVARLRHPRCAGDQARAAGRLHQRRQRGRAVRAPPALRGGGRAAVLGRRDRRHRARRRRGGERPGRQGSGRDGRRARARADPDARAARRGPAAAGAATAASSATRRAWPR